ncbi:MAG TPA: hypothetical protein VFZ29_11705 [Solirubrobacterales bacterium]
MKVKMLGLVTLLMATMAFAASTASATTLEVGGVTKNQSVTLLASLEPGTSFVFSRTDGSLANTCTEAHFHGSTSSPFTGTRVTGALTTKFFAKCSSPVTVHKSGQFFIEHIAGTTNGTLYFENTEVTVQTPFGNPVNCRSGEGTDVGKVTGVSSGNATVDFDAVFNCGFLLPSATMKGVFWVTSPGGFGVSA